MSDSESGDMLETQFQNVDISLVFWGGRGVIRLLGTPLRENCRAPLAGMADWKSEGKAEALGIYPVRGPRAQP